MLRELPTDGSIHVGTEATAFIISHPLDQHHILPLPFDSAEGLVRHLDNVSKIVGEYVASDRYQEMKARQEAA